MKRLIDVNVLLALTAECNGHHAAAKTWWERLPPAEILLVCRPVQTAFLRLVCTPAVMGEEALALPAAWRIYATLLASGRFDFVVEPRGLDVVWERFCRPFGRSPKIVMDAYLAAFAVAGGYRLVTLDRAFGQFKGLVWECPAV